LHEDEKHADRNTETISASHSIAGTKVNIPW